MTPLAHIVYKYILRYRIYTSETYFSGSAKVTLRIFIMECRVINVSTVYDYKFFLGNPLLLHLLPTGQNGRICMLLVFDRNESVNVIGHKKEPTHGC